MVQGIGSDIIEIDKIKNSIDQHGSAFLNRLFSEKEQQYCQKFRDPSPHFSGRFAAKEAVSKALGTGFGAQLRWLDFEILNDAKGKPTVVFSEIIMKRFNNPSVLLTISHCTTYAIAMAIWE